MDAMAEFYLLARRAVVAVEGDEATDFLQGLVTQDIETTASSGAVFSALLTPQGKILFDFFLATSANGFFIDVDADAADALVKRLTLYKLRAKVTIERRTDLAVGWSPDDEAGDDAFKDPRTDGLGARRIGTAESFAETADAAYAEQRLIEGVPEFGQDFASDSIFLLDVNYDALNGVDYKKGCFVGQEVTSRMKRKGDARKRTFLVAFDGVAPDVGASVTAGGATLGEITSVGDGRALARVRVDRIDAASEAPEIDGEVVTLKAPDYL